MTNIHSHHVSRKCECQAVYRVTKNLDVHSFEIIPVGKAVDGVLARLRARIAKQQEGL